MKIDVMKFRGGRCFKDDWAGFDAVRPINLIIGRNNTGKSQLLELVKIYCQDSRALPRDWEYSCEGTLDEPSLRARFAENTSGGDLSGNHWLSHGAKLIGKKVRWKISRGGGVRDVEIEGHDPGLSGDSLNGRKARVQSLLPQSLPPLEGKVFRHILADRDIRGELASPELVLAPDGSGATNIIRRLIISSSPTMPRELIQVRLREALNVVFGSDGHFDEIQVQQHDEEGAGQIAESWEVYLGEAKKGLVALSKSGSGLKTVILVLLNLLVIPSIERKQPSDYVFAFEELENNLHPSLLRRLLRYVEDFSIESGATVFLTTHSSAALDAFSASPHAQIIHVAHDGASARSRTVDAHFDRLGVVSELGAKPSDLLQANGIVWVEGPSDAIYLNKWIDLLSDGRVKEGRDYVCAFYGGALLARTQFVSPEAAEDECVNLILINPNVVVVCDSDRSAQGKQLKPRVRRIRDQLREVPDSIVWVTEPREVENYLPGDLLGRTFGMGAAPRDPEQYESFFPRVGDSGASYLTAILGRMSVDKVELAVRVCAHMSQDDMRDRFDWERKMRSIVDRITQWKS